MKFEIKNRFTGAIIFSIETETWRLAVEAAYLSRANLSHADLSRADFSGAYLSRAYLSGTYLSGANLSRANLSHADLSHADLSHAYLSHADLSRAYLSRADLSRADFSGAYLSGAYLSRANLSHADLSHADFSGAYLSGADLSGTYLSGAIGINKNRSTPLRILLEQPGPIWAYKLVNAKGEGPFSGGINYLDDKTGEFSVRTFNADENEQCGAGINLATLDWVMREWRPGFRILIMEFFANEPNGNLCVPTCTDGKFRVRTCRRVGEKDLGELGLVKKEKAEIANA